MEVVHARVGEAASGCLGRSPMRGKPVNRNSSWIAADITGARLVCLTVLAVGLFCARADNFARCRVDWFANTVLSRPYRLQNPAMPESTTGTASPAAITCDFLPPTASLSRVEEVVTVTNRRGRLTTSTWPSPESSKQPMGRAGLRFCPTPLGRLGEPGARIVNQPRAEAPAALQHCVRVQQPLAGGVSMCNTALDD